MATARLGLGRALGRVELLVHRLHAHQQQQRGQEVGEALERRVLPEVGGEHLEARRREHLRRVRPAAGRDHDEGDRQQAGRHDDDAVRQVGVRDGDHAADRDEENDERGGDRLPHLERHLPVGDHVEDVAAGPELVRDDRRERDDERDGAEEPGEPPVAHLEDVAHRVLAEGPDLRGDEVDDGDAEKGAGRLPDGAPARVGRVLGAGDEGPRSDPRADQREDHLGERQAAPGHHEVVLGLDLPRPVDVVAGEDEQVHEDDPQIDAHGNLRNSAGLQASGYRLQATGRDRTTGSQRRTSGFRPARRATAAEE